LKSYAAQNSGNYEAVEKYLITSMKDNNCSMMAKTEESFMHDFYYWEEKNRPRLISSMGPLLSAVGGAYNRSAMNALKALYGEHIPLGLNSEQTEEFLA